MPCLVTRASACALLLAIPTLAVAQDRECTVQRPRVEALRFEGNPSIDDAELRSIIFTERAGRLRRWFGWDVGPAACLSSSEMERDARRIALWYERRGYPGTTASATRVFPDSSSMGLAKVALNRAPPG